MGPGAFKRQRGPVSTFRNDLVSADIDSTGARAYPRAPLLEQCQIVGSPAQAVPGFRGAVTSTRSKSTKLPRWSHEASKFQRTRRLRLAVRARRLRSPIAQARDERRRFRGRCQINFDTFIRRSPRMSRGQPCGRRRHAASPDRRKQFRPRLASKTSAHFLRISLGMRFKWLLKVVVI